MADLIILVSITFIYIGKFNIYIEKLIILVDIMEVDLFFDCALIGVINFNQRRENDDSTFP